MKSFEDICKMSQPEVKSYMHKYLVSKKYSVINRDGFLYAAGDIPVLIVAHMDTVHATLCKDITNINGKLSSPQGIGGDDRCGIFMIMNIIKELHCSVLLCEDEEIGGVGAKKFINSDYAKDVDVNYIIELDRRGSCDAVFYSCDNKEFKEFICDTIGFREAFGSFSDISILAPALKIAAVNLSCGYYNAHTMNEYVVYDEMMDVVDAVKALITVESEKFEYVAKKYGYLYSNPSDYYFRKDDQYSMFETNSLKDRIKDDLEIEIEVIWTDVMGNEDVGYGRGNTKAEAWLDFFMGNEHVSFDMIEDYSFN